MTNSATPAQRNNCAGTPKGLLTKRSRSGWGAYDAHEAQVSPLDRPSVRPCITPFIPSVMTTAGTPSHAMHIPLVKPTSAPRPRAATTASGIRAVWPRLVVVRTMAAPLRTQGMDRSIPPTSTTSICPAATNPMKLATTSMTRRFNQVAKSRVERGADGDHRRGRRPRVQHPPGVRRQAGEPVPQ